MIPSGELRRMFLEQRSQPGPVSSLLADMHRWQKVKKAQGLCDDQLTRVNWLLRQFKEAPETLCVETFMLPTATSTRRRTRDAAVPVQRDILESGVRFGAVSVSSNRAAWRSLRVR